MPAQPLNRTHEVSAEHVSIGHDILSLISSAMYVEPLTIYRELVQNAADAIDEAVEKKQLSPEEGRVEIQIDPLHRQVIFRDNGVGVSNDEFAKTMCAIGSSPKRGTKARGFRGIGRLVGLGYAQELVFRSRSDRRERVMEAVWNARLLKDLLRSRHHAPLADVVAEVVTITERPAMADEPGRFFEVELRKVVRLASDGLCNAGTVENYLSEVAPVPYHRSFRDGVSIAEKLRAVGVYPTINLFVNGSSESITRPYRTHLAISASKAVNLNGFTFVEIPAHDGDEVAAVAWVSKHENLGAFPRRLGVRGLRARLGNLQIGNDRVFAGAFKEERFSDWCVGEVHVIDPRIVPNGRRDDFEPNLHFENLVTHLAGIGRSVAKAARTSSLDRRTARGLSTVESTLKEYRRLLKISPEAFVLREELLEDVREEMEKANRRLFGADRRKWEDALENVERQIEAVEAVRRKTGSRASQRAMGRVDVIRLLRERSSGGLATSTDLLRQLTEERFDL
jgi:hypothetical protein